MNEQDLYHYWEHRHDENFYEGITKVEANAMVKEMGLSADDFLDFTGSEESTVGQYREHVWQSFSKYLKDTVSRDEVCRYKMLGELASIRCVLEVIADHMEEKK